MCVVCHGGLPIRRERVWRFQIPVYAASDYGIREYRKTLRLRQPLHHTYHMLKKRRILQNFTKLFAHIQYFLLSLRDTIH